MRLASVSFASLAVVCGLAMGLSACSGSSRPKPLELPKLQASTSQLRVKWSVSVPDAGKTAAQGAFSPAVSAGLAVAAGGNGDVVAIDLASGAVRWRQSLKKSLVAGVGTGSGDAEGLYAVVSRSGELILLDDKGAQRWAVPLGGLATERPELAGGIVAVRLIDNRLLGFDQATGERRWIQQRPQAALVLNGQAGLLVKPADGESTGQGFPGANDLVAALPGGRLLALEASSGRQGWEATISTSRGSNEVERINDLLGTPVVQGDQVCVASYQSRVACVAALTGRISWSQPFSAAQPVGADNQSVYAVDAAGRVQAFGLRSGEPGWRNEQLLRRMPSYPVSFEDSVYLTDYEGELVGLSRATGQMTSRQSLGGVPAGAPRLTAAGLLVQTRNGKLVLLGR